MVGNVSDFLTTNAFEKDLEKSQFANFLKQCTETKTVISGVLDDAFGVGFYDVVANNIWLVEDKFYCRGYDMRDYSPINVQTSLRFKGYLSKKITQSIGRGNVMGIMTKFEKLKSSLRQIDVTGTLKIESMSKLRDPGVIVLWSPVGAFALFGLSLSLFLLSIQLVQRINLYELLKSCKTFCQIIFMHRI